MKTGRDKRIAEEIRREVSQILNFEIKDPGVMGTTVTGVKVSPDLRLARVYYALPNGEARKVAVQEGLTRSAGYIRHLLAERMQMKFIPQIEFFYDESLEIEEKIQKIFSQMPTDTDEAG